MARFQVAFLWVLVSLPLMYGWNLDNNNVYDNEISSNLIQQNKPQFTKLMSILIPNLNTVCPDHSQCQGGTCCLISATQYGCCPLPNAVCCSDRKHCCPSGYECEPHTGNCRSKEVNASPPEVEERFNSFGDVNEICPDHTQCNGTCCKQGTKGYGCCPYLHGVCCSDYTHCCPPNTVCNVQKRMCERKQQDEYEKRLSYRQLEPILDPQNNTICPDHSQCEGTCCKISQGYGCCPLQHAVCCADKKHCCPQGSTCDLSTGTCRGKIDGDDNLIITESGLQEIKVKDEIQSNRLCPDRHTQCNATCCKSGQGYACCPLRYGVCCADQKHCCPEGSVCDVSTSSCRKREESSNGFLIFSESGLQELEPKVSKVCPGGQFQCDETCCWKNLTSSWSCCPYVNGICCNLGDLCCPEHMKCDIPHKRCISQNEHVQVEATQLQATFNPRLTEGANDVICPGGNDTCEDKSTCCLQEGGGYGCCNFKNAVCCSDKIHCCPSGMVCNLRRETCDHNNGNSKPLGQIQAPYEGPVDEPVLALKKGGILCPGAMAYCPDGMTCCLSGPGEYACCPLPDAVCCSDLKHCCAEGTHCDTTAGTCNDKVTKIPWVAKVPSLAVAPSNQACADNSTCTDIQTCCQTPGQQTYYCCPYQDGVCCASKVHCCLKAHHCSAKGKCRRK